MSTDRSAKTVASVFFFVAAVLLIVNSAATATAISDWTLPVAMLLIGIAFVAWGWLDDRAAAAAPGEDAGKTFEAPDAAQLVIAAPAPAPLVEAPKAPPAVHETPPAPAPTPAPPPTPSAPPAGSAPVVTAPEAPPIAEVKRPAAAAAPSASVTPDNLEMIEGIGPKMAGALRAAGIDSFAKLAKTSEDDLRAAIKAGGMRLAPSVPTWAQQAGYAAKGDWDGLKAFQETLTGGRKKS